MAAVAPHTSMGRNDPPNFLYNISKVFFLGSRHRQWRPWRLILPWAEMIPQMSSTTYQKFFFGQPPPPMAPVAPHTSMGRNDPPNVLYNISKVFFLAAATANGGRGASYFHGHK